MPTASLSTDQRLLARLQAPPDLRDGVESLGYWRDRRRQLPLYHLRARREAARMTLCWERRVQAALLVERGTPIGIRLSAGLLLARARLRRWGARAALALTATFALAVLAAPVAVASVLLLHAL